MDHRVPRTGAAISAVLALAALLTFLFLNNRFEGPDPTALLRHPYQLTASFKDTRKLPTKQPVLYKGVAVGRVNKVDWDPDRQVGVVTFTLDSDFELHRDASVEIGERSLLGDPYLAVVSRGSAAQPELGSGDRVADTRPSVDFDEALDFLDRGGRRHVASLIDTVAEGVSPTGNGERLNGTIGGVNRTVRELDALTRTLKGQRRQIAGLVSSSGTVLSEIGSREQSLRTIVGSGRQTLDALASNTESLDRAMAELPRLLGSGRSALAAAEPLFAEARPLARKLRGIAPSLTRAFDERRRYSLGTVDRELIETIDALPALRERAVPVLGELEPLLGHLRPLVKRIAPASRNLVPALRYLTPRTKAIADLYALIAATANHRDSVGRYLRTGFGLDPAELSDTPEAPNCDPATQNDPPNQGFCNNAYPGPDDALDPQPFQGHYPRLRPCKVPSREHPRRPCR